MVREKMTCLLCRGLISFKERNQTRFLDHMKQEHNVRYDFNILLVATLLSEAEKIDIVENYRDRFEPQIVQTKNEDVETYVIVDEENSSEPLIKCKFCDLEVSTRLELKNHMMNDHHAAKPAEKPNDKVAVETKTAIPVAKESIEGVLKCKVCGKYIKQSLMAEHKVKHMESKKEEKVKQSTENTDGKSKNKIEEGSIAKAPEKMVNKRPAVETKSSNIKPTEKKPEPSKLATNIKPSGNNPEKKPEPSRLATNIKPSGNNSEKKPEPPRLATNIKPTSNNSEKKLEPPRLAKRKTLADKDWEEEDNDDSDDEDFDPAREKAKVESPKQQPCKYFSKKFGRFCSKKFSSKVRLLSHMRVSHEVKPPGQ